MPEGQLAETPGRHRWWRRIGIAALALVVLFGLIQLIPYGHGSNPPVTKEAVWTNLRAQTLAKDACYDCHSNLTKRWWGTRIAPVSWLAESDVNGGRRALNFSEWDKAQAGADEVIRAVQGGSMPPIQYKLIHGDSRLTAAERQQLAAGLRTLYAATPPAGIKHGDD
jgi:heme-binding protein